MFSIHLGVNSKSRGLFNFYYFHKFKSHSIVDLMKCKGYASPTCTAKKLDELFGDNSTGIYVRWFGKDQEQPPIKQLDKLYINHDLGSESSEFRKSEIVKILSEYYDVDWDYSDKKSILIKEKGESKYA